MKIEPTKELVEMTALAALNGARANMGGRPVTSFDGMKFHDAEGWRSAARAALEAIAPIIADQVLERAAQEYARRPDVAAAIRALKEPTP